MLRMCGFPSESNVHPKYTYHQLLSTQHCDVHIDHYQIAARVYVDMLKGISVNRKSQCSLDSALTRQRLRVTLFPLRKSRISDLVRKLYQNVCFCGKLGKHVLVYVKLVMFRVPLSISYVHSQLPQEFLIT